MMTFNIFIWLSQEIQPLSQYFMQKFPSMLKDTNQKDNQPCWLIPSEATSTGYTKGGYWPLVLLVLHCPSGIAPEGVILFHVK